MDTHNNNETEGLESPVSEDAFEQSPVQAQYQTDDEQERWLKDLEASRKERKTFNDTAVKAIKRYRDDRDDAFKDAKLYNIYFSNTEIKLSALYARTPKADIKRRFDDTQDDVARVAGILLQRNLDYEMDSCNFDASFKQVLFDHVVPGMGVSWLRLEERHEAQPDALDPTGQGMPQEPLVIDQSAHTDYVAWDDFFWSPCKVWTMCSWVARRIPMTREAIQDRFGHTLPAELMKEIQYSDKPEAQDAGKSKLAPQNQTEKTADVYEIWDKERRLVFWVNESSPVPLDVQPDTMEFDGFFPTPLPPLGRFDTSNTIPISDYSLVKGKYAELDALNNRCNQLSKALGVRFAYDASNPELKDLYTIVGENEGVGVKDWNALTEKGGLTGSIQFAPLEPVANAFSIASAQLERIKGQILEVEGISDIMRGQSMPYETATATTLKGQQSFGRFAARQQQVAEYVEALLRLKAHVICKFYKPELIVQRAMPLQQADQQFIGPAIQLLKDELMSLFRLSVSVDSLQLPNWNTEKAERSEAIQAITKMMSVIMPAVQQTPEIAPLGLEMIKFGISGFKGAQSIEGVVDQGLRQLMQAKQQGQGQGQQKPAPEQIKAQAAMQKTQADLQITQMQEETKRMVAQMDAQVKQAQMAMAQQKADFENRLRAMEVQIRQGELAAQVAHQQATQVHNAALDLLDNGKIDGSA